MVHDNNSTVKFTNNKAKVGETIFSNSGSRVLAKGNSSVTFNNHSVEWCDNACLPYTGQGDVVTIYSNGIVLCSDQTAFICLSTNCHCNKLEDLLNGLKSNETVHILHNVTLSSDIQLSSLKNISIIGHNNPVVICINGGGLTLTECEGVLIESITWIRCGGNSIGGALRFHKPSKIIIQKCSFQHSLARAIEFIYTKGNVNINHCNFMDNNHHEGSGACIYFFSYAIDEDSRFPFTISNCKFIDNGAAMNQVFFYSCGRQHSSVYIYLNNSTFQNNRGSSIHLAGFCGLKSMGKLYLRTIQQNMV